MSALTGGFATPAHDSARAFRSVMEAMARPGQIHQLQGAAPPAPLSVAAGVLLLTLLDEGTPLYLCGAHDCQPVRDWVTFHTGAPLVGPETAAFALGDWAALQPLDRYALGDPAYPDRSATLIVECDQLATRGPMLTGPGIETATRLNLPETAAFRANRALFPLGFDTLFTAGDRIAGLPRSTRVEAI